MILKTKNGDYVELTKHEYNHFLAELLIEVNKIPDRIKIYFQNDTRVEAAKLLLNTVAQHGNNMDDEMKKSYLKTAHELLEQYNQSCINGEKL